MKRKQAKSARNATIGMTHRKFLGTAGKTAAVGAVASSVPLFNIVSAATSLRTIGLGVSIINEIQSKASEDLGLEMRGQCQSKRGNAVSLPPTRDRFGRPCDTPFGLTLAPAWDLSRSPTTEP